MADVIAQSSAGCGEITLGHGCEDALVMGKGELDQIRMRDQEIDARGLVVRSEDQQSFQDRCQPGIAIPRDPKGVQLGVKNVLRVAPRIRLLLLPGDLFELQQMTQITLAEVRPGVLQGEALQDFTDIIDVNDVLRREFPHQGSLVRTENEISALRSAADGFPHGRATDAPFPCDLDLT